MPLIGSGCTAWVIFWCTPPSFQKIRLESLSAESNGSIPKRCSFSSRLFHCFQYSRYLWPICFLFCPAAFSTCQYDVNKQQRPVSCFALPKLFGNSPFSTCFTQVLFTPISTSCSDLQTVVQA